MLIFFCEQPKKKNQGLVEKKSGGQKTFPEEKGAAAGGEREREGERKKESVGEVPVGLPNRSEKKNAYALEKFHPREQRTIVVP
jgi:hypothetical protein